MTDRCPVCPKILTPREIVGGICLDCGSLISRKDPHVEARSSQTPRAQ